MRISGTHVAQCRRQAVGSGLKRKELRTGEEAEKRAGMGTTSADKGARRKGGKEGPRASPCLHYFISGCRVRKEDRQECLSYCATVLLHFPDVAGAEELVQVAGTFLGDDFLNLILHDVFVARQIIPSAEDADGSR